LAILWINISIFYSILFYSIRVPNSSETVPSQTYTGCWCAQTCVPCYVFRHEL